MQLIPNLAASPVNAIENACRNRCLVMPVSEHVACVRVLGGDVLLYIETRDIDLAPHLALDGFWELWVTRLLAKRVQKGWRCVDVGANVGYYSMLLGKLGCEVLAVEPQAQLANLIRRSCDLNGLAQTVSVLNHVAWSEDARFEIYMPERLHYGGTRITKIQGPAPSGVLRLETPGSALDRLVEAAWPGKEVDFIKIDAEGSEPEIWKGMAALRARHEIKILLEWDIRQLADPAAFVEAIANDGFRISRVTDLSELERMNPIDLVKHPSLEMLWLERPPRGGE